MSTDDAAHDLTEADFQTFDPKQTFGYSYGYTDGYRRALEDAADDASINFVFGAVQLKFADWLRDRAAGVGTKDGDDEIEVPCLSCNDDPNVDCPVGCGRR